MTQQFNRQPLQQGCFPQQSGPPTSIGAGNECAVLPQLKAAYYALLAGNQTAQVRDGERWQTYAKGDAKFLQQEIRRLEMICESNSRGGRAIRAGGLRKPGYGPYGYGGGYGGYGGAY